MPSPEHRRGRHRRRSRAALVASLLLHGSVLGWLAWHVTARAITAEWRAAAADSTAGFDLQLRRDEDLLAVPDASTRDEVPPPTPPLPQFELTELVDEPPDPVAAAVEAMGPGAPQDAEHPIDLAEHRRDWLRRIAATPPAAPPPDTATIAAVAPVAPAPAAAAASDGGDVAPSPIAGSNRPPRYPFVAFRRSWTGTVVVLLTIDANGAVTDARIERSSGHGMLDDAALDQLATWRFAPARHGGAAVPTTFRQPVTFRLVDGRPVADT